MLKVGTHVRIKSIEWYNNNVNEKSGSVTGKGHEYPFSSSMKRYCGQTAMIIGHWSDMGTGYYTLSKSSCVWHEWMFETIDVQLGIL